MYNPARQQNVAKRRRQPDPHAGTKHSDIVRRAGVGVGAPTGKRDKTQHGFAHEVFSCEDFVVRYETMYAGNNTGMGVSEEGDRTIRVLNGSLFVSYENKEGAQIQDRIHAGQHFHAPRGVKYGIATTGTEDVELLFVESPDYAAGWELDQHSIQIASIDPNAVHAQPSVAAPPRRSTNPKAQQQAEAMQRARTRRKPMNSSKVQSPQHSGNINSASQPGAVNLQPMGEAALAEE